MPATGAKTTAADVMPRRDDAVVSPETTDEPNGARQLYIGVDRTGDLGASSAARRLRTAREGTPRVESSSAVGARSGTELLMGDLADERSVCTRLGHSTAVGDDSQRAALCGDANRLFRHRGGGGRGRRSPGRSAGGSLARRSPLTVQRCTRGEEIGAAR